MREKMDISPKTQTGSAFTQPTINPPPHGPGRIEPEPPKDQVEEASEESFPASDPPAHGGGSHT